MKGGICNFVKWQIHPFISKETKCGRGSPGSGCTCHLRSPCRDSNMMKMSNDGRQLGNVSCLHVNNFSLEYVGSINETFTNHQKCTLHTEFKTQVRFVANFKISTRHDAFWLAPLDFAPPRTWYTDTKLVTWLVEVGGSLCFTKSKYLPSEDPTPLDVDHAAHVCRCIGRPRCVTVESY